MTVVGLGLIIVVVAVAGYFVAPAMEMDGLSWALGAIFSGIVVAVASISTKGATKVQAPTTPNGANRRPPPKVDDGDRTTIYVGNLAFKANRHALAKLFEPYGNVLSARVATDRNTRKPRGYGFVEMNPGDADKAMSALDGETFFGRKITVTPAKEQRTTH